jgi:hypothetical protein
MRGAVHNGPGTIDKSGVGNIIVSCVQNGEFAHVADRASNTIKASPLAVGGVPRSFAIN